MLAGVTAAALVASLAVSPVAAGDSTITAPRIVYTGVNQTVDFSGTDAISGESRVISMDAAISASCNPTAPLWSIDLCGRVQITLNDAHGGTLFLADTAEVPGSPGVWLTASGALIDGDNPTDPALRGGPVLSISMNGLLDELNGALADLQYIPGTDYEDGTYDEVTPPGPGTPNLNILVNDGSVSATNASTQVILRVEAPNGGPTLAGPAGALDAAAGVENDYPVDPSSEPALFSVIDPELCLGNPNNRCDGAYPDGPLIPEPHDAMLLVMWLAENSCGQFELRSTTGFTNFGGAALPSVNAILTAPTGLDLEQDAADEILATLGTAGTIDLSAQAGGLTTVFAATAGSIDDVRYALSQLTYKAPADDATCNLNIAFSDLGNNGMPKSWDPTPVHEIPNAKADVISATFNVADGQPAVTIDQILPSQAGDPAGPNKPSGFKITFADAIDPSSFDVSDLSLSTSSASGAVLGAVVPESPGLVYTVPVTATGDGTITLEMAAGAACAAGHGSASCDPGFDTEAPTYDDNEITWDQTGPAPTIAVKVGQANPSGGSTVTFEVDAGETFSSSPASFDGADIDLAASTATTGSPTVTWQGLANASMFDVSVPVTSSGDVVAKVTADAYVDTALNGNSESGTATVTVDQDAPTPTIALEVGQASPTSTSPIALTATFDEPVTDFDASDVTFAGSTAGGTLVANVSGGPMAYDILVSGMTTTGDVSVGVVAGAAEDAVANASGASNTVTVAWEQVVDATKPDVTINQAASQADPTAGGSIAFDVTFSEPVSGFAGADIDFTGSTAGGTLAADVTGGPTAYTITVTGMTGPGTVVVSVPAGVVQDAAANTNNASSSTDASVAFDNTPPTITVNQGASQADPTSTSPITFDVVFSEPVTGFATGDVTLGGTAGATTAAVSGGPSAYTVSVTGMTSSGTVTTSVAAGKAADAAGNPNDASTSTDNAVQWNAPVVDNTPPTVTIDQAAGQADPASTSPVVFTAVFSEPVTGLTSADINLAGSTAGGTLSASVSGGPSTYTVSVIGMTTSGTVVASVTAAAAQDGAGNPNDASTSTDNSVTWNAPPPPDTTKPTVTVNQGASQADPTSTSPITFDVVFSEPVTGFATGDVALGGTAGATTAAVSGGPTAYTVTVSGMATTGTVTASIAAGAAQDAAANPNDASTSTDNAVTWNAPPPPDTTDPTVTIEQAAGQGDPSYGTSVRFKVTFSEPVTGFGPEDIILGGTAGPTSASVTEGPSVYAVTVTGMTTKGTVTMAIAAGGVLDLSGNANEGSTAVDSSVTWRGVRPAPSVSVPPTDSGPIGEPVAPAQGPLLLLLLVLATMAMSGLLATSVRVRRKR